MSIASVRYNRNFTLSPYVKPYFNKSTKPVSSLIRFPISNPVFLCQPISRPSFVQKKRILGPKTMTESIRAFSIRDDDIEGLVGGLETEAILSNGSSEFRSNSKCAELESTLNSLSKWLVAALFGTVILWRHDAEALWAALGSVLNTVLSLALKRILNQERPFSTSRSDPGMPSSHAQSIFFAVIFVIISMVKFWGLNGVTVTVAGLALASGSYFSWLRVAQKLHTINQVIVGAIVGTFFSILWFQVWDAVVLDAFISYLWVRIIIVFGSVGFCLGFLVYIIQHWLVD